MKTYNIRISDGETNPLEAVPATLVHAAPIPCFLHKEPKTEMWTVTEMSSGFVIAQGPTRKDAIANAMHRMTERPGLDAVRDLAAKAVARYGAANEA